MMSSLEMGMIFPSNVTGQATRMAQRREPAPEQAQVVLSYTRVQNLQDSHTLLTKQRFSKQK